MSKLEKITRDYRGMENYKDLKKHNLTLSDVSTISRILYCFHTGTSRVKGILQETVANYFKKYGFLVTSHNGKFEIAI